MIWRLTYCNKDGDEARLDIIKGASTPVEVIEGTATPFILNYKMDKGDKSGHVMSSSADISIFETSTFNIDNLKTSSETEIKVEYYINDVLDWSGFVIPDFFSKTIGTPSTVEMTASDRLSTLKSVTLTGLTTRVSLRSLLVQSLARTELTLPLTATATFTHGTTNVLDTEVSSQRLVDNKGRSISCYDIIKSILITTNATLSQNGGEWVLKNKIEHEAEAASVTFNDVGAGARRTIVPVASSVGVFHEHGGGRIYPENNNFNNGLSGWTAMNGFTAAVDNKKIDFYLFGSPSYSTTETVPNYLRNNNERVTASNDLDTAPYIESDSIPIVTTEADRVKLNVDISVTAPGGASHLADPLVYPSFVRYAVLVTDGTRVLALNRSGALETYDKTKSSEQTLLTHVKNTIDRASIAEDVSKAISAELVLGDDILSYSVKIRIYGSGTYQTVLINHAHVSFTNTFAELPKGSMYKTRQGANYTKVHDPDTAIFGDYLTGGLNGYFYTYPIDDTSSLYLPDGDLSRSWTAYGDSAELPLLQHVTRQRSRLFSVAHDILRATIDVATFNPMAVYQDCAGNKYVIVSASFDFLRSTVDAELEQVAYGSLEKKDYIYSYFGEGEEGISSIGGISSGGGGGGSTHSHTNKEIIDQITQDNIDVLSRLSLQVIGTEMVQAVDEFGDPVVDEFGDPVMVEQNIYGIEMSGSAYATDELSAYGYGGGGGGGGGIGGAIATLSDVQLTGLTSGQILEYNGTHWVNVAKPSGGGSVAWADITGKPTTFAPSAHTHAIGDVTGLQTALNGKQTTLVSGTNIKTINGVSVLGSGNITVGGGTTVAWGTETTGQSVQLTVAGTLKTLSLSAHTHSWSQITSKPTTFAPSAHSHVIGDVTGLQTALDGKASTSHSHSWEQITSKPTTFTPSAHTHSWSDITGKPTTFAPSAHSHAIGDVTGLQTALDGKASTTHSHAISDVTGLQTTLDGMVTIAGTQTITGAKTFSAALVASVSVQTPKVIFAAAGWAMVQTGTELQMQYNGVVKQRYLNDGSIAAIGELTAYAAVATGGSSDFLSKTDGGTVVGAVTFTNTVTLPILPTLTVTNLNVTNLAASTDVTTPKVTLGNGWTIEQDATTLTIRKGGVVKYTVNA